MGPLIKGHRAQKSSSAHNFQQTLVNLEHLQIFQASPQGKPSVQHMQHGHGRLNAAPAL